MSGEPVISAMMGPALLGEVLSLSQWFAIAFVVLASVRAGISAKAADYDGLSDEERQTARTSAFNNVEN